ncbi:hypothetical protein JHK82_033607 [Glycine max]|uniref:Uncharacterized protein n=1 Tax=Glycine soja TaxID=3848 RepID=A0A0B2QTB7_GLYSO|nr:hypothetical protein JHK85_034326 [Glycine max]KAG4985996.1 hypothetical protein JHK86_033687 [Glycine max]KAG5119187.1 hypothetical protein JHK82_033607 [Glycine max]KAG5140181.1 hypothetical protein JHK84_033949 [Glycine max]KHN23073.1 hypothetical protein glysoja_047115 [Glycine soja]
MDTSTSIISDHSNKENVPPTCNCNTNKAKSKTPIPHIMATSFKNMKRSKRMPRRFPLADMTYLFNNSATTTSFTLSHQQEVGIYSGFLVFLVHINCNEINYDEFENAGIMICSTFVSLLFNLQFPLLFSQSLPHKPPTLSGLPLATIVTPYSESRKATVRPWSRFGCVY